jgi:LacI family transcriptional regulator
MGMDDFCGHKLIHHAVARGLRVPQDVAVLGVNNASWLTELAVVPMSSIEMNKKEIGYQAAKMLDAMLAGSRDQTTHWIPPVGVAVRQSTDVLVSGDPIISKALSYIRDHCHEGISVEDVVNELHVSRRTLEVHLKRMTGQTPQMAIFRAQINRAKKMLVETNDKIWSIALECGFDAVPRFYIVFKRETGMTPSQYRQQN